MKRGNIVPLQRALQNILQPTIVKVADGSLKIPDGREFAVGDDLVVFMCSKCIGACDNKALDNLQSGCGDVTVDKYEILLPADKGYKFYDRHCVDNTYHDLSTLSKDFPRFIRPVEDFFAPYDNDVVCEVKKISKGEVLELKEIRTYNSSECKSNSYVNVSEIRQTLVCRSMNDDVHGDVLLQKTLRIGMQSMHDPNAYTLNEINERFQFPREVQFCDKRLDKLRSKTADSNTMTIVAETGPALIFGDAKEVKMIPLDDAVRFENLYCISLDELEASSIGVQVQEHRNEYEKIQPVYAIKIESKCCYQLYGLDPSYRKQEKKDLYLNLWENQGIDNLPATERQTGTNQFLAPETTTGTKMLLAPEPTNIVDQLLMPEYTNGSDQLDESTIETNQLPSPETTPGLNQLHLPEPISETLQLHLPETAIENHHSPVPETMSEDHQSPETTIENNQLHETTAENHQLPVPEFSIENRQLRVPETTTTENHKLPETSVGTSQLSDTDEQDSEEIVAETKLKENKDIADMNVTELCVFLERYKLKSLAHVCRKEMVDGKFLVEDLSDIDLEEEPFKLRNFDIKKLNKLKTGWRPEI